jgi:hypothetical protein
MTRSSVPITVQLGMVFQAPCIRSQVERLDPAHRERVKTLREKLQPTALIRASVRECVCLAWSVICSLRYGTCGARPDGARPEVRLDATGPATR